MVVCQQSFVSHAFTGPLPVWYPRGHGLEMLKLLIIKNIALIPSLEIALAKGLTLLTGETGAGKSILVDSLGLLLGARASSELIRTGVDSASVEGLFETKHAA